MKIRLLLYGSAVMLGLASHAGIIYGPANPINATIPDNSVVGWAGTATASGFASSISAITVNLNISGGYNGDLYAYLSYGGVLVPLLNRVGVGSGDAFGYGDTGFNVTLSSAAAYNVHAYGANSPVFNGSGQLTGTWQPDGRNIDPQGDPSTFDSTSGLVNFGAYDGMNPNGTWTLFISDVSPGGQGTVVSWELGITAFTAVPERVNAALGIFAGIFLVVSVVRSRHVRKLVPHALARCH